MVVGGQSPTKFIQMKVPLFFIEYQMILNIYTCSLFERSSITFMDTIFR